jgi:hypothetical protein
MTGTIKVESELANAYNSAPEKDRERIQLLMRLWLQELSARSDLSLTEVMDMISERAQARGLTPQVLTVL